MFRRIALIANGIAKNDPGALETILRKTGQDVDIFDVRDVRHNGDSFDIKEDGVFKPINPNDYAVVTRIIKGGVSGDTEKSWALQKFFEDHGAKPHIGIDAARKITDRILCKNILTAKNITTFPSVAIGKEESKDEHIIETEIKTLGEPPYAIRRSIGSGKNSIITASSLDEAIATVNHYRNVSEQNLVKTGVLVHKPPLSLDNDTVQKYGLDGVTEPEKRSYQFRIILVDGKIFGANIAYSEPGRFGLNPAQGATFKAVPEETVPMEILALAKRAAEAHEVKIAAVDIALDNHSQPRVLDMNASPDLSFTNARGEQLKYAVAKSIEDLAMQGLRAEAQENRASSSQHRSK